MLLFPNGNNDKDWFPNILSGRTLLCRLNLKISGTRKFLWHLLRRLYFYLDAKWLGLRVVEFMDMGAATAPLFTLWRQLWAAGSLEPEYKLALRARGQEALAPPSLSSGRKGLRATYHSTYATHQPLLTCRQPGRGIHLPLTRGEPLPALGPCCCSRKDRWHRFSRSQGALGRLARVFPGALLEDLDHCILLQDLGMEHL